MPVETGQDKRRDGVPRGGLAKKCGHFRGETNRNEAETGCMEEKLDANLGSSLEVLSVREVYEDICNEDLDEHLYQSYASVTH